MTTSDTQLLHARIDVRDADSGRPLLVRGEEQPGPTASVMKVVTCAAALATLPQDFSFETALYRGEQPGELVLRGGGDVTISRQPEPAPTLYDRAPRLQVLAQAARAELQAAEADAVRPRIHLDDSRYRGGEWSSEHWLEEDRHDGYICFMTALLVDGDKDDATDDESGCGEDPTGRAGQEFVRLLGRDAELLRDTPAQVRDKLAEVHSAPLGPLVEECLRKSDNPLAEALAREVALARGLSPDFAGVGRALADSLPDCGLPRNSIGIIDGSGLSEHNSLPAKWVVELITRAYRGEEPYARVLEHLPRTGSTFSSKRFTGANEVGDAVRAKSGFINTVHSLAGIVRTVGGRHLSFGVFVDGRGMAGDDAARDSIDAFVARMHREGDALLAVGAEAGPRRLAAGESALTVRFGA